MKPLKIIAMTIISLTTCFFAMNKEGFAEPPFGTPKARAIQVGAVPFDIAQKVALKKAYEIWGQAALGTPLACADDDGDIVAYIFPFAIAMQSFPTYSSILYFIQDGRKIAAEGFEAMSDADKLKVLDDINKQEKNRAVIPGAPDLFTTNIRDKAYLDSVAKKFGRQKMIGADRYGTIVVSARYDRFPVPLYTNYLPPYYYHIDLAEKTAAKALSAKAVTLERIYFLENRRALYFEFSSNEGNILMNAFNLNIEPSEAILTRKGRKVFPEPEMSALIDAEWAIVKGEAE